MFRNFSLLSTNQTEHELYELCTTGEYELCTTGEHTEGIYGGTDGGTYGGLDGGTGGTEGAQQEMREHTSEARIEITYERSGHGGGEEGP